MHQAVELPGEEAGEGEATANALSGLSFPAGGQGNESALAGRQNIICHTALKTMNIAPAAKPTIVILGASNLVGWQGPGPTGAQAAH